MQKNLYDLKLDQFDGPLDLLLSLVQDKKIDILEINLAELASQYLQIINNLKESDLDIAGEYLLMASTLLQLKTKMLLSDPKEVLEVEQDKNEILRRLSEYKQFKNIAETLKEQELKRQDIFIKEINDIDLFFNKKDSSVLDGSSNALKLIVTLKKMFERVYSQKLRMIKFETFNLTAKDQEKYIRDLFKDKNEVKFEEIFTLPSMNHFVITFLALLDLARKQEIIINQDKQFETIQIFKGPEYER
ncbi:segregation/condensation protein A [Mycoplasmopsis ciconiae]|uniref:Segregation and condensation protein A n=1 Tax=Mycoplasmopsis ciconiae TaxID=561067 RepID=A0ABU7MLP4_9BACT|nr:segregation/condensation protein A [Mycoplasmopsis ciconiae]